MNFFLQSKNSHHEKLIISYQVSHIVDSFQYQLWVVKNNGVTNIVHVSTFDEPRYIMTIDDASRFNFDDFIKEFIRQKDLRGSYADIDGVISIDRFNHMVEKYTVEFNEKRNIFIQKQELHPSPIYQTVKNLGLQPFNSGYNEYSWHANCPRGKHNLFFNTENNNWGCGYCKKKGGPDDLINFTGEFAK